MTIPDIQHAPKPIPYNEALDFMQNHVASIRNSHAPEKIWFLSHPHVITLGTGFRTQSPETIHNIPVIATGRGGKATYHGPGQRILYLMIDLRSRELSISQYMLTLREWVVGTLLSLGISSYHLRDPLGVWINIHNKPHKIAAFGVRVSRGVAWHGLSINHNPNLSHYQSFSPCGLSSQDYGITSLHLVASHLNITPPSMEALDHALIAHLPFSTPLRNVI